MAGMDEALVLLVLSVLCATCALMLWTCQLIDRLELRVRELEQCSHERVDVDDRVRSALLRSRGSSS